MNPPQSPDPSSHLADHPLLSRITANMQDGLTVVQRGAVVFTNDRACEIFGYSREELSCMTGLELAAPEERQRLREIRQSMQAGHMSSADCDFWIVRKDGSRRFVRNRYQVDPENEAGCTWFVFTTDITEHKLTLEALESSERQFRQFVKYSPVGVYRTTPDGRILLANPALIRMLGYTSLEELAKRDLEGEGFEPAYPRSHFRELIEKNGEVRSLEVAWTRRDGSMIELSENARAVRDKTGQIQYYEGTVEDITRRRRALRELQESEQRYRELIEALPHGVAILQHARVAFVNQAGASIMGYRSPEELIGQPASDGLALEDRDRILDLLRNSLDQGEPWPIHYTATGVRRDGTRFPAEVYCTRITFGRQLALQVVLMDLTERQRAEQERQKLQTQLHQADKLSTIGQLAAGIAHEINNPLAFVLPGMEFLRQQTSLVIESLRDTTRPPGARTSQGPCRSADVEELGKEVNTLIDECQTGMRRIRDITRELRQFSRIDDDAAEEVMIQDLIESALTLASNEIKYRARVVRAYTPTPSLVANRGKLVQVFLNLIINAAHAIVEGDADNNWIRVSTGQSGKRVFARIANSGAPIPEEIQAKIFDPFFTTKPRGQGTGLGLSISYSIVQQHRGRIELERTPDQGTTFGVWLPLDTGMRPCAQRAFPSPSGVQHTGRILVVDDEAGIRHALQRDLAPHQVVTAASGQEALELIARDQAFDLILCDLMMPEVTGMDVATRLASGHPVLAKRLVLMTGGAFTPKASSFLRQSGHPCLEKPLEPGELQRLVQEKLEHEQHDPPD